MGKPCGSPIQLEPVNPAKLTYTYSVAGQDLFSRWTPWVSGDYVFHPIPVQVPSIANARSTM